MDGLDRFWRVMFAQRIVYPDPGPQKRHHGEDANRNKAGDDFIELILKQVGKIAEHVCGGSNHC